MADIEKKISVDKGELGTAIDGINVGRQGLSDVKSELRAPSSGSIAMRQFERCVRKVEELKREYDQLILKDWLALQQMSTSLAWADFALSVSLRAEALIQEAKHEL